MDKEYGSRGQIQQYSDVARPQTGQRVAAAAPGEVPALAATASAATAPSAAERRAGAPRLPPGHPAPPAVLRNIDLPFIVFPLGTLGKGPPHNYVNPARAAASCHMPQHGARLLQAAYEHSSCAHNQRI